MNAREILSARTIVISAEPHAKATPQQIPSLEASYASRNPATLVLEQQRYDGSSSVIAFHDKVAVSSSVL